MKRFDLDDYMEWVAAIAATGMTIALFVLVFGLLWTLFHPATRVGAPKSEADATVGREEAYIAAVLADAVPDPNPVEIDPEMLEQLAIGIYREGGGDAVCDQCRLRIGDVMLNRVEDDRFPDTLEGVLTQKGQYGTMYWDGIVWPERASKPVEAHAVERARETAERLLSGEHSELFGQGYIFQSEFPELGEEATECCGIYYAKG